MTLEEAPLDLDGLTRDAREMPDRLARFIDFQHGHPMYVTANGIRQEMPARLRPDAEAVCRFLNPSTVLHLVDLARLGEAWREAEEALPDLSNVHEQYHWSMAVTGHGEEWRASAWATWDEGGVITADGPTPTAALQALAAKLREPRT